MELTIGPGCCSINIGFVFLYVNSSTRIASHTIIINDNATLKYQLVSLNCCCCPLHKVPAWSNPLPCDQLLASVGQAGGLFISMCGVSQG